MLHSQWRTRATFIAVVCFCLVGLFTISIGLRSGGAPKPTQNLELEEERQKLLQQKRILADLIKKQQEDGHAGVESSGSHNNADDVVHMRLSLETMKTELQQLKEKAETGRAAVDTLNRQLSESQSRLQHLQEQSHKPRIAIVSLFHDEQPNEEKLKIVSYSLRNKLTYAHKHGYTMLYYHNNLVDRSKTPHWSKLIVLKHYIEMGKFDWLFWIDMDALIMNMDITLESFIEGLDPKIELILNTDWNGLNNGVFMIKCSSWAANYLDDAMGQYFSTANHGWKEQQAQVNVHTLKPETEQHIKWVSQRTMNSYPGKGKNGWDSKYQKGDFVIHFAGQSRRTKLDDMRFYLWKSPQTPKDYQVWTVEAVAQ